MSSFDVRFEEKTTGDSVLEIVSPARKSTLENVRSVLFDLRIQIVRVESSVRETGLVERFFVSELDSSPVSRRRAAAIRGTVRKTLRAEHAA
jgi:hypothetical protein